MPGDGVLTDLARHVAALSPTETTFVVVGIALAAGFAVWRARSSLARLRLMQDMPTATARGAAQGYTELEGTALPTEDAPIVSPLSGLRCCWYRYLIEERVTTRHKGQEFNRWQTVSRGESSATFWLQDKTGRVLVNPDGADIEPRHRDVWHSRSGLASAPLLTPSATSFLTSTIGGRGSLNPYRFTEWRIDRGDPIYAIGLLKNIASHNTATVDMEISTLLSAWKNDQPALRERFDLNKDGRIDQTEWSLARAQARREVMKARTEETKVCNDGINVLGPTHDTARPFILSTYLESDLIKRYRWATALYGAGFFTLGISAVWIFNTRFG